MCDSAIAESNWCYSKDIRRFSRNRNAEYLRKSAAHWALLDHTNRGDDGLDLPAMNVDMVVAVNAKSFDVQQAVEWVAD